MLQVLLLGGGGPSRLLADGRRVTTEYTFVEERSYSGREGGGHTHRARGGGGRAVACMRFAYRVMSPHRSLKVPLCRGLQVRRPTRTRAAAASTTATSPR